MLVSVEIGPDDIVEAIEALSDAQLDVLALQLPDRLMDRVGPLMETLKVIEETADLYSERDELDLDRLAAIYTAEDVSDWLRPTD